MGDTLGEVAAAIQTVEALAQAELPALEAIFPGLAAINPFLGLFKVVLSGVNIVHQATGAPTSQAVAIVSDHNTPGAAAAPALGPDAPAAAAE